MIKFKHKNIAIFGFGKSGIASARRLSKVGANVKITETLPREKFNKELITELENLGVSFEFGTHTLDFVNKCDIVILSPGVHSDLPIVENLKKQHTLIISEIELAYEFLSKPIIAITGTNGKTTTATLIGEILKERGKNIAVAGNIGVPLVSINDYDLDLIVVEVSSYQLENIIHFKPWISIILNITSDHLERHGSFSHYIASKGRIFKNQTSSEYLIYNADDKRVIDLSSTAPAKRIPFSKNRALSEGIFLEGNELRSTIGKKELRICKRDEIKLKGDHNLENVCASVAAAILAGIDVNSAAKTLRNFEGVEHRIEYVTSISGVDFFNDSKATNPDSTVCALNALTDTKNIFLIAGGKDKGGDLKGFCETIKKKAKGIILIGEARERFKETLVSNGFRDIDSANSLAKAVRIGFEKADVGDIVLLSPACASFDMFQNFEERGRIFKKEVLSLK